MNFQTLRGLFVRSVFCAAGATLLLLTVGSAPIRAQSSPKKVVVRGTVRDESSGRPLSGARVEFNGLNRRMLTDDGGEFEFVGIPIGSHVFWADQYGYFAVETTLEVGGEVPMSVEVPLPPQPVMLDGVNVVLSRLSMMETRLRSRQRASGRSMQVFEQDRLMRSASPDMGRFLFTEAFLQRARCPGNLLGSVCVRRRGRTLEPRVVIDERPVFGGIDFLATYEPHELYLLEVCSQGLSIHAYTHYFMERMARKPRHLLPFC